MRIWSIHPKYLDTKGLVAVWRETLLAKHVLEGKTKGYKNHPQLNRFKQLKEPLNGINYYLSVIHAEACNRQYVFDKNKVNWNFRKTTLQVTTAQLDYEARHLLQKLKLRDNKKYLQLKKLPAFEPHPLFKPVAGEVEDWEVVAP
jgi:hypothetical protein